MVRIAIIIASTVLVQGAGPLDAETLTCLAIAGPCQSPSGCVSHDTTWNGITTGDTQGNRWTTSRWQAIETTPVEPPGR